MFDFNPNTTFIIIPIRPNTFDIYTDQIILAMIFSIVDRDESLLFDNLEMIESELKESGMHVDTANAILEMMSDNIRNYWSLLSVCIKGIDVETIRATEDCQCEPLGDSTMVALFKNVEMLNEREIDNNRRYCQSTYG